MSDNVISLAGFALIGDAGKTMAEMHAEAIGAVELLRCVNLLELTPTQRQTCIKKLAWLKRVAAITSKAFPAPSKPFSTLPSMAFTWC